MKKQARITAFFLLAAITAQLAACGDTAIDTPSEQSNDSQVTSASYSADPASVLDLPDTNWNGREFRVLGYANVRPQFETFEIYSEGENGDIVNDAIYKRNLYIRHRTPRDGHSFCTPRINA